MHQSRSRKRRRRRRRRSKRSRCRLWSILTSAQPPREQGYSYFFFVAQWHDWLQMCPCPEEPMFCGHAIRRLELGRRTRVMGVVNITPDSFFDGGRFFQRSKAVECCLQLVESGADIIDLGGESSRPGAEPISVQEELERVLPVLQEVRKQVSVMISVDTYKSTVAREALKEGADIVNDISAFRLDPEMPQVVKDWDAAVVLMHMRGTPQIMQEIAPGQDILEEVQTDLQGSGVEGLRKRHSGGEHHHRSRNWFRQNG